MNTDGEWTLLDAMEDNNFVVVTEIIVVAKKENVSSDYALISENCFSEGMFSSKRYLAYSKKVPAPKKGRVGVTDLLVVSDKESVPLGYEALSQTYDDNSKSFSNKQLLVKYTALDQATHVINDVRILSANQKEQVPPGYKRLPEISGLSICFRLAALPKKRSPSLAAQGSLSQAPTESAPNVGQQQQQAQDSVSVQRSVIDDLKVKVEDTPSNVQEYVAKFTLPNTEILSVEAINAKFTFDWAQLQQIVGQT